MKIAREVREVKPSCIESDSRFKMLASDYRHSCRLLKGKIEKIKCEMCSLEPKTDRWNELEEQLTIINQMYRTTSEIGREAEHYYEKGWWRSEVYTLNTR